MVTYEFYKDIYLGSAISKAAFPEVIARAEEWIAKLERTCQVRTYGPDSRAMAVCSVAETMAVFYKKRMIKQESIGGVSIPYFDAGDRALQRQLLQNAGTFLDIRRGVK